MIFQTFEHHKVPEKAQTLGAAGSGWLGLLGWLGFASRSFGSVPVSQASHPTGRKGDPWRPPKRCRKDMKRSLWSLSNFEIGHLKLTMTRIFLGYAYVETRVVLCFRSFASLTCASFLHCPQSFPCSFFMCPCFVMFFCDIHDQLKERWSCVWIVVPFFVFHECLEN